MTAEEYTALSELLADSRKRECDAREHNLSLMQRLLRLEQENAHLRARLDNLTQ